MILVGQVSDGSLVRWSSQLKSRSLAPSGARPRFFGRLRGLETVAADLGVIQVGQGAAVGSAGTDSVAQGFGAAGPL